MGTLYVLDSNLVDTSNYFDWELLCEATGKVNVPAGKALRLNLSKEAGDDLSPLSVLAPIDLAILNFEDVEITDDQLQHIARFTSLRVLNLSKTGILGTGLKYLSRLKSLKTLWLSRTHVGDNELAYLSYFPSLKRLELSGTPTNDAGMVHVEKITSLESLSLSKGVGDEGLRHLKNLTSLRSLIIKNPSVSDKGISYLTDMTQMESLQIQGIQTTNEGLLHLNQMKKLKSLYLIGTRVTGKGIAALAELPHLKTISLTGSALTSKEWEALGRLTSLEYLDLNYIQSRVTDADIACISGLCHFKRLAINPRIIDDDESITFAITDKSMMHISKLKALEVLSLSGAKIKYDGLQHLASIPELEYVGFGRCEISEQDLEQLKKKLPGLSYSIH